MAKGGRRPIECLKPGKSVDTDAKTVRVLILIVQRNVLSGKQLMYSPWSLESRIQSERCTSGSGRGYERPMVERSHGARSLLYSLMCDVLVET